MKLYYTVSYEYNNSVIKRIGTTYPETIRPDRETVYLYDWDEVSDIPLMGTPGTLVTGVKIESNYKEDCAFFDKATNKMYLVVNKEIIPFPDDYKRFKNLYEDGKLIKSEEI